LKKVSKAAQYCYATADYPYGIIVLAQVALGSGLPRFHADTNAAEFCKKQGKIMNDSLMLSINVVR
jgi:hypothetical protein